jgi:hypothetical protein
VQLSEGVGEIVGEPLLLPLDEVFVAVGDT